MHRRPWRETITAKAPLQFDALDGEILDLRNCCLSASASTPVQLRCVVGDREAFTVARLSPSQPSCRLAARFTGKTTLAISGQGELCLGGLLFSAEAKARGTKRVSPEAVSQDIRPAKQVAPAKQVEPAKQAPAKSPKQAPAKQVEQHTQSKSPVQAATKSPQVKPAAAAAASPKAKPAEAKPAKAQAEAAAPSALTPEELKARAKAAMERRAAEAAAKDKPAAQAEVKPEEQADSSGKAKKKKKGQEKEAVPLAKRTTNSGLQIEVMKAGSGREALLGHPVKVKYQGWLTDGTSFDKGEIKFRLGLGEVIVGWDEGVKGMRVGEERRLLVPPRLGYGLAGAPPAIPPNAKLVFQVQLLDI